MTPSEVDFEPTGDKIVLQPLISNITAGGVLLSDVNGATKIGKVLRAGPGRYENGEFIPTKVCIGDEIIYLEKFQGDFLIKGKRYYMIEEKNLIGYYET